MVSSVPLHTIHIWQIHREVKTGIMTLEDVYEDAKPRVKTEGKVQREGEKE